MIRRTTLLATLLLAMGCQKPATEGARQSGPSAAFWPSPQPEAAPKVLIVGWDGVRPDIMAEVETPNLDRLLREGTFNDRAVTARPTVSGPCWSSILTGTWPEKHGVLSNDFSSNRYDRYPDLFTLVESQRPDLNTFVVADWLPLVADDAGGPVVGGAVDRRVALDGYEEGWSVADSLSVEAALEELGSGNPDLLFVYAGAPDEISHESGGIGTEYREAIAAADGQLGRLLEGIQSRPSFPDEDWLVLVTTDHGRTASGGHGGDSPEETTVFLLISGSSAESGTPEEPLTVVDIVPTAFFHLGLPTRPEWELDGKVVGLRQ